MLENFEPLEALCRTSVSTLLTLKLLGISAYIGAVIVMYHTRRYILFCMLSVFP